MWTERLTEAIGKHSRLVVVLAGSNGAGKTTFYRRYLEPAGIEFVNADEIARNMNPADPGSIAYEAMGIAEQVRESLLQRKQSFCIETVLSDTQGSKLTFFRRVREAGYGLIVIFIRLDSAMLSQARVHQRVRRGGHSVPDDKLLARFPRTQENAAKALAIADLGLMLDNSSAKQPYQLVEIWQGGNRVE
ncbi:MAG: AAA family ATPase [Steroidobacteraceae bacterium]